MAILAIGIEYPRDIPVQRLHDRRAAAAAQQQHLDCRLPFGQVGYLLRQFGDVVGGILKGEELPAVRQGYRILELALPTCISHASPLTSKVPGRREARLG